MRKNKLKHIWQTETAATSGWLHIPNTWSAEIMANAEWDCVTVDMQHGLHSMETAIQMLQAISTTKKVPLARVNWNEPGSIMRLLDGGAYGIICPMINTKQECEKFVGACKYPPMGYRSFGPTRARVYGGEDYGDYANNEIVTLAMVESEEAVKNIDEICSVKGLDAIFVGSGDLRLSLTGSVKKGDNEAVFNDAIQTILESCKAHNIIPGIWCATVEDAKKMVAKGYKFIALKSDSMMLTEYANAQAKALKNYI